MGKYAPRVPKERTIYSNYDLWETYPDDYIKNYLMENGYEEDDITDEMIMEERYFNDEIDWETEKERLKDFFLKNGNKWIIIGQVGRWDGVYKAGTIFETFDAQSLKPLMISSMKQHLIVITGISMMKTGIYI